MERQEKDIRPYWMTLSKKRLLEIEKGNIKSHSVENLLRKRP
jgi:hypothetical protein